MASLFVECPSSELRGKVRVLCECSDLLRVFGERRCSVPPLYGTVCVVRAPMEGPVATAVSCVCVCLRGLFCVCQLCQAIGNLCRHSSHFYPLLAAPVTANGVKSSLVAELAACCSDSDASTRKYASCAVRNASALS